MITTEASAAAEVDKVFAGAVRVESVRVRFRNAGV